MSRARTDEPPAQRKISRPSALAALLLMVATFLPVRSTPAVAQRPADVVVIMSTASGITNVPADVVRSTFMGLRVEYQGVNLVPFNLPQKTAVRERMDRVLLGLEQTEVSRFWIDQRIRDGRTPPRTVPTVELLVRIVAQFKGAIAGVPANMVGAQTRAVRIDGKDPSESGYLLADK
jgi:hypothetical protein